MSLASNVAYRIQYIHAVEVPQEDQGNLPQPATALTVTPTILGVRAVATIASLASGDLVEFYASIDNDRTHAQRISLGTAMEVEYAIAEAEPRWFWVRVRRPLPGVDLFSPFYPTSPTGGVVGAPDGVNTDDIVSNAATEVYTSRAKVGGTVTVTSTVTPISLVFNGEIRTSVLNIVASVDCTVEVSWSAIVRLTSVSAGVPEVWYAIQGPSSQGEYGSVIGIASQTVEFQFAALATIDLVAGVSSDITAKWAKAFGLSAQGVSVNSEVLRVTLVKK